MHAHSDDKPSILPLVTQEEKFSSKITEKDYCLTYSNGTTQIGVCEVQGKRRSQEDALVVSVKEVENFHLLSKEQQEYTLAFTFAQMQEKHGNKEDQGSTGCSTIAYLENQVLKTATANLGDSTAFIIIVDKDNQLVNHQRLNRLHRPSDPQEYADIIERGGYVRNDYLNDALALNRTFGDRRFEGFGLSHITEVSFFERLLGEGQRAFLLVACDGLEEGLSEKSLIEKFIASIDESPAQIAGQLTAEALKTSQDNISIAVSPIDKQTVSATIFDGHSGNKVSFALQKNYYPTLQNNIEMVLKAENFDELNREFKEKETALDNARRQWGKSIKEKFLAASKNIENTTVSEVYQNSFSIKFYARTSQEFEALCALAKKHKLSFTDWDNTKSFFRLSDQLTPYHVSLRSGSLVNLTSLQDTDNFIHEAKELLAAKKDVVEKKSDASETKSVEKTFFKNTDSDLTNNPLPEPDPDNKKKNLASI